MSKRTKLIVIISVFCAIVMAVLLFGVSYILSHKLAQKSNNIPIPDDTKLIKSSDTHGGFHGDGEYFAVYQLSKSQENKFLNDIKQNGKWKDVPLPADLNTFIFGYKKEKGDSLEVYEGIGENKIPNNIKDGKYYFRDKYIEYYPEYKCTSILDPKRYSSNFTFAVLDRRTRMLYILGYDS